MQDYKIVVEHESINIGKELNNYAYIDTRNKTAVIDDFNHAIDAIRYNVTFHLSRGSAPVIR